MDWIRAVEGMKKNESVNEPTHKTYETNVANSFLWGNPPDPEGHTEQDTEAKYAYDERQAIIEFDGGPCVPCIEPVGIKMASLHLGRVSLACDPKQPGRVVVGGVAYRNHEVKALMEKELEPDDLKLTHEVKKGFEGEVMR